MTIVVAGSGKADDQGWDMSDTLDHWRELNRRNDLSGVGHSDLPPAMNAWLYKAHRRQVRRLLREMDVRPSTVYDVGAGTGYWTSFWRARGADVNGCDFTPEAVERLGDGFERLDISTDRPTGTYELVWVMNVLLHVLDDASFTEALANVAGAVAVGGRLIMFEPIQVAAYQPPAGGRFSKARPARSYLEPLIAAGLTLVDLRPATAITSDPIEGSSKLTYTAWRTMWRALKAPTRVVPATGWLMGSIAYLFDPLVLRLAGGVTSKLVVLERAGAPQTAVALQQPVGATPQ